MIRKTTRIHLVVTKEIGQELKKESKKSKKYMTELLMEGWELYKTNKAEEAQNIIDQGDF